MAHRSSHEINQQLERYVFGIASQFIDRAEPATQQSLIAAASRFITIASSDTADTPVANNLVLDILNQPSQQSQQGPDRRLAHRQWLIGWLQQQRQYQLQRMAYLDEALLATRQRYRQIQDTVHREPYRSRLLARCQRSLAHFQQCLESAHTINQSSTNWLHRLQFEQAV